MSRSGAEPSLRVLDSLRIEVARPMVLMRLGYRRASQVPEKTARLIGEVMERGHALLAPKAILGEVTVEIPEPGATLFGGTWKTTSRSVGERFAGCHIAVLFAATVGPALEAWGHEAMDSGQMTKGLLIDAFGSGAATALGLALEGIVEKGFRERGLEATKRYAPGYGDWPLSDQAPLFGFIDAARVGIRLTEDHLMLPAKSISGAIGGRPEQRGS